MTEQDYEACYEPVTAEEQAATAKAEAALAPLEAKARALREQQRAKHRAEVLREAADAIEADSWSRRDRWGRYEREEREAGMCDAAALLRRMADEAQR